MNFIPEFNYWIYDKLISTEISDFPFHIPVEIATKWKHDGSILSLLFDDSYSSIIYSYDYRKVSFNSLDDFSLTRRLSIMVPNGLNIYVLNDEDTYGDIYSEITSSNLFDITAEEENLLNCLLDYRNTDTLGYTDTTSNLSTVVYYSLSSGLSKLIYIYLNLMINDNLDVYKTITRLSDKNRMIEVFFEKYVIDAIFAYLSEKNTLNTTTTDGGSTVATTEFRAELSTFIEVPDDEGSYYVDVEHNLDLEWTQILSLKIWNVDLNDWTSIEASYEDITVNIKRLYFSSEPIKIRVYIIGIL